MIFRHDLYPFLRVDDGVDYYLIRHILKQMRVSIHWSSLLDAESICVIKNSDISWGTRIIWLFWWLLVDCFHCPCCSYFRASFYNWLLQRSTWSAASAFIVVFICYIINFNLSALKSVIINKISVPANIWVPNKALLKVFPVGTSQLYSIFRPNCRVLYPIATIWDKYEFPF